MTYAAALCHWDEEERRGRVRRKVVAGGREGVALRGGMLTLLALGEHVHVVLAGGDVAVGVLEALLCKGDGAF